MEPTLFMIIVKAFRKLQTQDIACLPINIPLS
jgi:hypothetical protein